MGFFYASSRCFLYSIIASKDANFSKNLVFASSTCHQLISRTLGAKYSMLFSSLTSQGTHFVELKQEIRTHELVLGPEEDDNARKIRSVILNLRSGTVNDVVQALQSNPYCLQMHLTTNLVASLLQKFGDDWKSALGFFQWASSQPGYRHTSYSYNKMVDLLGKMRQMEQMWGLVETMRTGGFMTLETVAKVMRRLAGAGRWRDAVSFFDDLELMGFKKDTASMNLLLDTLCKEKKVVVAREVFMELKSYVPADAYTFNILVHGWCNARRVEEAVWTIQEMKGHGLNPSVITYSTILKAYCKRSNFCKMYELLDEMAAENCPPNVVTYTMVINSLAKSQDVEQVLNVVERMKSSGCKPDTRFYNSLIDVLGKAGKLDDAFHIFDVEMKMNGLSPDLSTYNIMISIFCQYGQEQNAFCVLKEMENSSCKPVLQTYNPLFKLYFRLGKLDDQLKSLLSEIVTKHHLSLDLDTYTLLIHGLCTAGNAEWAYSLFDEMISQEIVPRIRTCWLLMDLAEQKRMDAIAERIKSLLTR